MTAPDFRAQYTYVYEDPDRQARSDAVRDAAVQLVGAFLAPSPPIFETPTTPQDADPYTASAFLALRGLDLFVTNANAAIALPMPVPEEPTP